MWFERSTGFLTVSRFLAIGIFALIIGAQSMGWAADIGLSQDDLRMADAVIAENTLTLRLPGMGTSVDGPGPLTNADRLILLALQFHERGKGLVPFSEMKNRLNQAESRPMYRHVGEEFWAWYRKAADKGQSDRLGGLKGKFGTYIAMKNTARRKAVNQRLRGQVESEVAWRKAMESDARFREKVASRADQAAATRAEYLEEWHVKNQIDSDAAQAAWDGAMVLFPWRSN